MGGGGLETKHRKAEKDCGWGGGLETKHRKAEKDCGWGGGSGDET